MPTKKVIRRELLKGLGLAVAGAALAGCAPEVVKETVIVEKPVEKVVEKVVKETVIVEGTPKVVEKVVTATPAPMEPVTIRMITHWTGEDAHTKSMQLLYKRFQEVNPDVKLDIVEIPNWGQANSKTQLECGVGTCPDVAFNGFNSSAVIDAGLVLPTGNFIGAHEDVIDSSFLGSKYKDQYWKVFSEEINAFSAIYSRDLLKEIGMSEFPGTWDELLEAGEAVKAKGKALMTFRAYAPWLFGWVQSSTEEGAKDMEEGNWESPTWLQTMEAFTKLLPYLAPDELELKGATAALRVRDGEMLFYPDGQWMIGNTGLDPVGAAAVFGNAPFPTPAGSTVAGRNSLAIGNTAYANWKHPEKVDAAWRFLDFWCTDEEVAKSFIVDSQSPMGVRTDLVTPELAGPFLPQFIEAVGSADRAFAEAGVWTTINSFGSVKPAFGALASGQTAKEAVVIMMDIIKAG